ncbi:hypothetical protein PPTG_16114 [Phytophthora nicotianae INRA-310]|uniref:PBP domain-containing protein n=1 Tax=Phytophthora nicotianae (strain INRA-310) TaxID=761204 RepID=W2PR55_PHYN3|nr:hypothetical protein PPTG_16114 [Phytophthora nicotianae INRA-310]ETN03141.1 hypothetical protein PPTG_16114 [Phytophthora nicotianae INRA-310]
MQFFALLVVAFILLNSNVVAYTKSGEETKTIDLHYADAIAEGGYLVLYMVERRLPHKITFVVQLRSAFRKSISLSLSTTASKYQSVHIDTRYVEKYNWDWVTQLASRMSASTAARMLLVTSSRERKKLLALAPVWGQRMGILSKARHPAAAKLFMNWIISEEAQTSLVTNSVRTDINTNNPWDTPEANMVNFSAFMEDRATVEQWKQTCALYLGEVQGKPSPVGLVFIPVSDSVGK